MGKILLSRVVALRCLGAVADNHISQLSFKARNGIIAIGVAIVAVVLHDGRMCNGIWHEQGLTGHDWLQGGAGEGFATADQDSALYNYLVRQ